MGLFTKFIEKPIKTVAFKAVKSIFGTKTAQKATKAVSKKMPAILTGLSLFSGDSDNEKTSKESGTGLLKYINSFRGKNNSIPYKDASVFVFSISDPTYIIENLRNKSKMSTLFFNLINKIILKPQLSGADILAFEDVEDLKSSGLPFVPVKNEKFFKLLKKYGNMYAFYGPKCYWVFVDSNKFIISKSIDNLIRKFMPKDENLKKSSIDSIIEKISPAQESKLDIIKNILDINNFDSKNQKNIIDQIIGDDSKHEKFSFINDMLNSNKSSAEKTKSIFDFIDNKNKTSQTPKAKSATISKEELGKIQLPTY